MIKRLLSFIGLLPKVNPASVTVDGMEVWVKERDWLVKLWNEHTVKVESSGERKPYGPTLFMRKPKF